MNWKTSSFSTTNGQCVEVATDGAYVYLRHSQDPSGGTLRLAPESWVELLGAAKAGDLDDLT